MRRDAVGRCRVVVTGMGLVSPLGCAVDEFWRNLTGGRVATGPVTRFATQRYPTKRAAEVLEPELTAPVGPDGRLTPRSIRYVEHAVGAALADVGPLDAVHPDRVGVVLGTVMGTRPHLEELRRQGKDLCDDDLWDSPQMLVQCPAARFDLRGPSTVISAGCAAGNTAIGMAVDMIRSDWADCVVAGGVDELSETVFQLFTTLRALAGDVVRPFDEYRDGMMPAEGAGVLVVESLEHALARGATIHAEILGHAVAADAHHMTAPHPKGDGMLRCMRESMAEAGLSPPDVDYVSAHGTGTVANDSVEATCLLGYFDRDGVMPAVSSVKGMLGHSQGAASALEAIACVLAIRTGRVPGNPTLCTVASGCKDLDLIRGPARDMQVRVALSNAFGFGGNTSTVVFGEYVD